MNLQVRPASHNLLGRVPGSGQRGSKSATGQSLIDGNSVASSHFCRCTAATTTTQAERRMLSEQLVVLIMCRSTLSRSSRLIAIRSEYQRSFNLSSDLFYSLRAL